MKDLGTVTLETERLILRKLTRDDAYQAFNNWTNDSETTKYVTWKPHGMVENTLELFEKWEKQYDEPYTYRWVVEVKELNQIIGTIDVVHKSIREKTAEIGYCYGSKYWGNGYGTEALTRVIDYLLNDVEFDLLEAKHFVTNPASGRVMEKSGMKYETILRSRMIDQYTGERVDLKVYSIMREDLYN